MGQMDRRMDKTYNVAYSPVRTDKQKLFSLLSTVYRWIKDYENCHK